MFHGEVLRIRNWSLTAQFNNFNLPSRGLFSLNILLFLPLAKGVAKVMVLVVFVRQSFCPKGVLGPPVQDMFKLGPHYTGLCPLDMFKLFNHEKWKHGKSSVCISYYQTWVTQNVTKCHCKFSQQIVTTNQSNISCIPYVFYFLLTVYCINVHKMLFILLW